MQKIADSLEIDTYKLFVPNDEAEKLSTSRVDVNRKKQNENSN